jgi:hypothetical protein
MKPKAYGKIQFTWPIIHSQQKSSPLTIQSADCVRGTEKFLQLDSVSLSAHLNQKVRACNNGSLSLPSRVSRGMID